MTELTMNLDVKSSKPLYEQIYEYIKKEIQNGGLSFKERLPSTRKLAKHLQVSRSTVDLAYGQLQSEGFIEAVPCKGYFISDLDGLYHFKRVNQEEMIDIKEPVTKYAYDFSPNGIDLHSFPYNAWRKLSKNILMDDKQELFMLGSPMGEEILQKTIAAYLHQARGVSCNWNQVIIGAGTDYLLMLLCNILGGGHRIAMENPTYKKAYKVLESLRNEMLVIDMDNNGMDIEQLEKAKADIAYVMPSHQYPLGTVMPIKRRMQLLKWANEQNGRFIIEDDYDSEFRYKGKPIPSLQGYDSHGKVVYIGTFSKSIAPAIRVSYMVLPQPLMEQYRKNGQIFSSTVSRVDQMIVAGFLNEGYYERHLNKMRAMYKSRHDILLENLKKIEKITVFGENAGVHLLVSFQNGLSEDEAVIRAKNVGVKIYRLSDYYVEPPNMKISPTVILGYANLGEQDIMKAVAKLKEVWNS